MEPRVVVRMQGAVVVPCANVIREVVVMRDLVYVLGMVVFFMVMLAYVCGCELLGRDATVTEKEPTP